MKYLSAFIALIFLASCTSSPWKDTGLPGPWCAPNARAHVFYRTVNSIGLPNPQGEMAFAGKSGVKKSEFSFHSELDKYFGKCTFINQWPTHGTQDSIPAHEPQFDLCLASINPTIVVGVERQNPNVSALWPMTKWGCALVGSTYLVDQIPISTNIPYYHGAKVIWFSPAVDYDLHQLELTSGTASFKIGEDEQMIVTVDGEQLTTLRK